MIGDKQLRCLAVYLSRLAISKQTEYFFESYRKCMFTGAAYDHVNEESKTPDGDSNVCQQPSR